MPRLDRNTIKGYFLRNEKPLQSQFASLIDSMVNIIEDRYLLGLRAYDPLKQYLPTDTMVYGNALYQCLATTTGTFNPPSWAVIASLGSTVYSGAWDPVTNSPVLADGTGVNGYYYVAAVAGSRDLGSGTINFLPGDCVIYDGSGAKWQRISSAEVPVAASRVTYTPNEIITSTDVQGAIDEVTFATEFQFAAMKKLVLASTYGTVYRFSSGNATNWGRAPLQIAVPEVADIFPGATDVTAKILLDYQTADSAAGCKMALINNTDYNGGIITNSMIMSGSASALTPATSFGTTTGPAFAITPGKSYCVIIQRTAGRVEVQAATLELAFAIP